MIPHDLVELGRVAGAYGVHGWVRIHPYSPQSPALLQAKTWWLKPSQASLQSKTRPAAQKIEIHTARVHGSAIIAQFQHLDNREEAQALKGQTIWVSRASFPPAQDDEYYWADLIGCFFYGEDETGQSQLLGVIDGIIDNGAHAVLQVSHAQLDAQQKPERLLDDKGRVKETLVPFVAAYVHTVNIKQGYLHSHWPL